MENYLNTCRRKKKKRGTRGDGGERGRALPTTAAQMKVEEKMEAEEEGKEERDANEGVLIVRGKQVEAMMDGDETQQGSKRARDTREENREDNN